MKNPPSNLGLNSGVLPDPPMTRSEVSALIDENQRRGGRPVTRKTQTQMYVERAASEKPPLATA